MGVPRRKKLFFSIMKSLGNIDLDTPTKLLWNILKMDTRNIFLFSLSSVNLASCFIYEAKCGVYFEEFASTFYDKFNRKKNISSFVRKIFHLIDDMST